MRLDSKNLTVCGKSNDWVDRIRIMTMSLSNSVK
jgi:hypothetical protein